MRRAPLLVLATLAAVLLGAVPAAGAAVPCRITCSCVERTPAEQVEAADVVAVVTVTGVTRPMPQTASTDPAHYDVTVSEAIKGEVPATVTVTSAVSGASCGVEMTAGETYLLLGHRTGEEISTALCDGTTPATAERLEEARAAVPAASRGSVVPPASSEGDPAQVDAGGLGWGWPVVILVGGVLALVAVVVPLVLRRPRR